MRIEHADAEHAATTVVDWSLGNICNYDCSYCPASVHDSSLPWPDLSDAIYLCERIHEHFVQRGRRLFFHFSGGEPTLYRQLPELLAHLKVLGARTGIISNGSRSPLWWEKAAAHLDAVVLTFHVEFAELASFCEVVRALTPSLKTHVNVTMLPERFQECLAAADTVARECPGVSLTLKPLLKGFGHELFPYSDEQKRVMRSFVLPFPSTHSEQGSRGDMRCLSRDGSETRQTAADFVTLGENRWRGWTCNAGIESISVTARGEVYRGVCKEGGALGQVHGQRVIFPDEPIICERRSCNCLSDIMITRWRG